MDLSGKDKKNCNVELVQVYLFEKSVHFVTGYWISGLWNKKGLCCDLDMWRWDIIK